MTYVFLLSISVPNHGSDDDSLAGYSSSQIMSYLGCHVMTIHPFYIVLSGKYFVHGTKHLTLSGLFFIIIYFYFLIVFILFFYLNNSVIKLTFLAIIVSSNISVPGF